MAVEDTMRKIKALKENLKHSKNPMEQRHIRANLAKLEKQLAIEKKERAMSEANSTEEKVETEVEHDDIFPVRGKIMNKPPVVE